MRRLALILAATLLAGAAHAAPTGNEIFFEAPYLSRVAPGTTLNYVYKHVTAKADFGEGFDETIDMEVTAPADDTTKRIASVEIHRGARESEAGPFPTMNGNPISLVLLERDVKEMAQLSKGSPFYLRNRLREHLASGTVEPTRFEFGGKTVDGWKLIMRPFAEDPNKDKLQELAQRRYEFLFSDEVPGGLYAIRVVTPAKDGASNIIETSLTLTGSTSAGATPPVP
ncbi:hypothetical protein [Ancylobacter radicis]|uniref:DUF3108 domain-containing protein n=1 Tax=Ancylobacter radicis TaxID=2836179 RepID=A0ABS5RAT3_9HYPH|nr:hypothetical protein [Ancylobacter radicis]MBS9478021.1 hypothetical protein [Ancylobacter radicis]